MHSYIAAIAEASRQARCTSKRDTRSHNTIAQPTELKYASNTISALPYHIIACQGVAQYSVKVDDSTHIQSNKKCMYKCVYARVEEGDCNIQCLHTYHCCNKMIKADI